MHPVDGPLDLDKALPLRRQVAEWLFERILTGEFEPGSRLVLNRLATQLGVSATPVREAMVTLESLGLLSFRHNCGATVRPFGVKQLREMYEVWNVLNLAIYRSACRQIERLALVRLHEDMLALCTEPDTENWSDREMALDLRLEELIAGGCGCRRLVEENNRYHDLLESIRKVFGHRAAHQRKALQEHIEIVEAMIEGDADVVASLAARHNYWCMKSLLDAFRGHRADAVASGVELEQATVGK